MSIGADASWPFIKLRGAASLVGHEMSIVEM
jgi:hypothetical protein